MHGLEKQEPIKHPYQLYEGTDMWERIDNAVSDLVRNGDLVEKTNRQYVVGYLCKAMEKLSAKF